MITNRKLKKLFRDPKQFIKDSKVVKFPSKQRIIDEEQVNSYLLAEPKKTTNKVPILRPKKLENCRLKEVQSKIKSGDLSTAKVLLDQLWHDFPWNILVVQEWCDYYKKEHKYDDALRLLDLSIARVENWLSYYNRGIAKQSKGLIGDSVIQDFYLSYKLSKAGEVRSLKKLLHSTWGAKGVTPQLISLCSELESYPDKMNAADYLMIASIYNEAGRYILALKAYKLALKKDKTILERVQYLPLLSTIYYMEKNELSVFSNAHKFMNVINSQESVFESLVKKAGRSISVVGNGPSELGKKQGLKIDKSKLVIRFNAYNTNFPLSEDYGNKTSVWVKAGNYVELPRRSLEQFNCIITSGYNPLNRNTMGTDLVLDAVQAEVPVNFIPKFVYEELISRVGVMPSAGLAILYWIYKIQGKVSKNNIYGFSFGEQKENNNEHYFINQKKSSYYAHNWKLEAQILHEITV